MKKNIPTPLADEYLDFASHLPGAETRDFFYTRLKGKMEKTLSVEPGKLVLRPALLAGALTLLLCINGLFLVNQKNSAEKTNSTSTIQTFASSYDLTISTPY